MGNRSLGILCYADDAVLMAEKEDNLQCLLYRFNTTAQKLNMLISHEKSSFNCDIQKPHRCKLMVNEHIIDQVMNFSYLGIEILSERRTTEEVKNKQLRQPVHQDI